jgi:hypothetical protein
MLNALSLSCRTIMMIVVGNAGAHRGRGDQNWPHDQAGRRRPGGARQHRAEAQRRYQQCRECETGCLRQADMSHASLTFDIAAIHPAPK